MNINAEIITIGDEILIGQIVDTNSAWISQQLNAIGINVFQITSISDNAHHISKTLDEAATRAELIIVTGGLGPTKDDITKQTIAHYFQSKLVRNQTVLHHIHHLFSPRSIKVNDLNEKQADLPDNCTILHNAFGTAAGMLFEKDSKTFVFLPGVPFEMKKIISDELLPILTSKYTTSAIVHKTLMLQGVSESLLAQHIEPWENQLPPNIKLAYLPSISMLKLRLTAKGDTIDNLNKSIQNETDKVMPLIQNWFFADTDEPIELTLGKLLLQKNKTIATAESCTGGNIAHLITSIPGCSTYFKGSIVAYANDIKSNVLEIDLKLINENGAVSKQVVEAMAIKIVQLMNVDYAIATSGIAGPDGGTAEKPVGTIWIAIASANDVVSKKYSFGDNNRERNIIRASLSAINDLRKYILQTT